MSDSVKGIARLLTEDPDVFTDYQKKFSENSVLDQDVYGEIVGILKDIAEKNGLSLDHRKLKVSFNPAGFSIKNIYLSCSDSHTKRDLAKRVADITGDDNIKHTFNKNLRVNLYNAINREFADRVREELNLEVTHQFVDSEEFSSSESTPMATFTQPTVTAEKPEEEMDMGEPMGAEPEGGPAPAPAPAPAPEEGMGMGGGMGMGMPGGGLGGGLGDLGELSSDEDDTEAAGAFEEPEAGPYGVEPPGGEDTEGEGGAEEAPPPEPDEEDNMLSFENIQRIAGLLTDDPDIFNV